MVIWGLPRHEKSYSEINFHYHIAKETRRYLVLADMPRAMMIKISNCLALKYNDEDVSILQQFDKEDRYNLSKIRK